jgi:hypothetical protein
MKTIDTLVDDMYTVIEGKGLWSNILAKNMGDNISALSTKRFSHPPEPRSYLGLSDLGTPCKRKLWFKVNCKDKGEPLRANTLFKFFYGDVIEELALTIAKQTGHSVVGEQDRLDVHGIKGHRDAVIDGMTIDVKSCSPNAFKKFKEGTLRDDDPFGYISQLSSYVYAGKDDDLVTNKTHGGFLAIDKVNGSICLDVHDFTEELKNKKKEVEHIKSMIKGKIPEDRIPPVAQSKTSPNMKLSMPCSYCDFKKRCWPNLRTFIYKTGPVFLTHVEYEPNVPEIKDDS